MIPTFAVVGHPNKGKSAIVSTLAENDGIAISKIPGTTKFADRFTFLVDNEPLYVLVDTPGFQRAKSVLDWLSERVEDASQRPELVRQFVEEHREDNRFADECTLLTPIIEGAGILYVVDGTKPFGPEYEIEMEVLRYSGQPRMALINLIGDGNYVDEWRQALGQYFSIVRVFDAMQADFNARVELLKAFGQLHDSWRGPIDRSIESMQAERVRRRVASAHIITETLIEAMTVSEQRSLKPHENASRYQDELSNRLLDKVRKIEVVSRGRVQKQYRHDTLARSENELSLLGVDLFTEQGWELFGLSKMQLVITGSVSGAIAGLGFDALVGGASLLLGSGIGAVIGGVGAWFGTEELAKIKVLGDPLGGEILRVGPIRQVNFPWVLLGRAWVHHHLVRERNHALRKELSVVLESEKNLMDQLPDKLRTAFTKCFVEIRNERTSGQSIETMASRVGELLLIDPFASSSD